MFGEKTAAYDYFLYTSEDEEVSHSAVAMAKESLLAYSEAFATGHEDSTVTAFLNATTGGSMTTSVEWKCAELSSTMRAAVSLCQDLAQDKKRNPAYASNKLVTRSRYAWHTSTSHVSSGSAVDALAGALGRNPGFTFPTSPRSYCIYAANVRACFSWSTPQDGFTQGSAEGYISDAESVVRFNTFSAQANSVLGGGDVCISNRPDGRT